MSARKQNYRARLLQIHTSLVSSGLTSAHFQVSTGKGDTATDSHAQYIDITNNNSKKHSMEDQKDNKGKHE